MSKRQSNTEPPIPGSIQEQAMKLNEAALDLWYEIGKASGVISLCNKFKWELKDWVKIRMQKENNGLNPGFPPARE
jgi:hypothetical protein